MPTYYVTKESDCPDCNGWGTIQHPAWGVFHTLFPPNRPTPPDDVIESFWADHGFSMDDRPDEQHQCDECNGSGKVTEQCDLRSALAEIAGHA